MLSLNYLFTLNKLRTFALLSCLFMHASLQAATLLYENGFETGNLTGLKCSGNCPTVVKSPVANGKYAGKFTLTRAMRISHRTEATLKQKVTYEFGKEYWLGLSYRYENWATDYRPDSAPFQMHTTPSSWTQACDLGSAASTAPFLMITKNGRSKFQYYGNRTLWEEPVTQKKWKHLVIHFKISKNNDGFVEIWIDGVKRGRYQGALSPRLDGCGKPVLPPYFKMGVYKWDWQTEKTDADRRELLLDNLKIATGANGFSLVSTAVSAKSSSSQTANELTSSNTNTDDNSLTIQDVQVETTEDTATITWKTNKVSDSLVNYGLNKKYGSKAYNKSMVTSHKIKLTNLAKGTLYNYKIQSVFRNGDTESSANLTFTTDVKTQEDLVAYWPMDNGSKTTPDISGNGYTARLINGASLVSDGGISFDGKNDYVDAGRLNVAGNALTIAGWFVIDDLSQCPHLDCRIISKATGTAESRHYFMISTVEAGANPRLRFRLKTNGNTSTLVAQSSVPSNRWVHVAAVYNGSTMQLYQDGKQVGSMVKKGNITTHGNSHVWIGGNPPSATARPWKGQIDDIKIYNYALTQKEIRQLYNE